MQGLSRRQLRKNFVSTVIFLVHYSVNYDAPPTRNGRWTVESLWQLKVFFFIVLYHNFVTYLQQYQMSSKYQITENCISNAIKALHDSNY